MAARLVRISRSAAGHLSTHRLSAHRAMCTPARPPLMPADRPDEQTVRALGESARLQQKMWDTFVPEQGIRFGDRSVRQPMWRCSEMCGVGAMII